jgi:hypothetical protein
MKLLGLLLMAAAVLKGWQLLTIAVDSTYKNCTQQFKLLLNVYFFFEPFYQLMMSDIQCSKWVSKI